MFIADYMNYRVRKVTISTGIITTFAGTGTGSYNSDGVAATSAMLSGFQSVATDSSGTNCRLYISSN